MAIAFIKHSFVGKSTQAQPYTASAHVRYISRKSATVYRYAERMPLQWHAAQRFLDDREDTIRRNGRVADKLVISLPREMSMDQAVDTVRKFGFQLSHGRAPFYFTIQNWGEQNPHCHFIFVDADIDTGKRVFRTTDRDSSERIKALWEDVCNGQMEEMGLDARISFDEAAEKKAARLEAERIASEPIPEMAGTELPVHHPSDHFVEVTEMVPQIPEEAGELPPDAPSCEVESEEPEEDLAEEDSAEEEPMKRISYGRRLERAERLEKARDTIHEMHVLNRKRADIEKARSEYVHWRNEAEQARDIASSLSDQLAEARQAKAMADEAMSATHYGSLRKGVRVSLFGFEYKSKGYRRAEQAEIAHTNAAYKEGMTASAFKEADQYAQRAVKNLAEYERKVEGLERQLERAMRVYGTAEDFDDAEQYLKEVFDDLIENMTPENVMEAVEEGYITKYDAREFLETMGHTEIVDALDEAEDAGVKH